MKLLDKIRGVFIGEALGDALGAPHEFRYHKDNVYTGLLTLRFKFNVRYQPTKWLVPGTTTDDTEMTLVLAQSLIKNKGYNRDHIILGYEAWANSTSMVGINTRKLFKGVKTVKGYQSRYNKLFNSQETINNNQSNGSMMRASPLAFLWDNTPIITDCNLTNPSQVNLDANMVYLNAIRLLVLGYDRVTVFSHLKSLAKTIQVKQVLDDVETKKPRVITGKTKGWVLHALYCAVWSLLYAPNYQDGIDYIIRLGGDTDTTAAISGALMGAMFGYTEMSKEDRTLYNIGTLLSANMDEGDLPRPKEYVLGPVTRFETFTNEFYQVIALPNLGDKMI